MRVSKHLTITIEARDGHALLGASKWFAGVVTSWMVGRQRASLTRTARAPGWLVRIEDRSLEVALERSVASKGLEIVK